MCSPRISSSAGPAAVPGAAALARGAPGRSCANIAATSARTARIATEARVRIRPSIVSCMARYTLVYGLRLLPEGTLESADDVRLHLKNGETAGLTLHTVDGTIPQLRRALDRSLDAFFEFLPGATDEDRREFDDS